MPLNDFHHFAVVYKPDMKTVRYFCYAKDAFEYLSRCVPEDFIREYFMISRVEVMPRPQAQHQWILSFVDIRQEPRPTVSKRQNRLGQPVREIVKFQRTLEPDANFSLFTDNQHVYARELTLKWKPHINMPHKHQRGADPVYRLSPQEVINIRRERAAGATLKELAIKYHVSVMGISNVARRKTHRHLKQPEDDNAQA